MSKELKHKHHIIPKHMGGDNEPSNIVELTIEEHAKAHKKLYDKHGLWQDKIAWLSLTKQITCDEARRLKTIESNKERWSDPIFNERTRKKISEAHKKLGKTGRPDGCNFEGKSHTEETKTKQSKARSAYWSNPENKKRMSEKMKQIRKNKSWPITN
tara:strand:+ start:480 stop:950 length:471 start_codon:yes stop_codon:yes gene_type:complete